MIASLVGNFPGSLINSMIGSTVGSMANVGDLNEPLRLKLIALLLAVCFAFASTICISVLGRRAISSIVNLSNLDEQLNEEQESLLSEPQLETPVQIPSISG